VVAQNVKPLGIRRVCSAVGLSRAMYYRLQKSRQTISLSETALPGDVSAPSAHAMQSSTPSASAAPQCSRAQSASCKTAKGAFSPTACNCARRPCPVPGRALSDQEEQAVVDVLHCERFVDMTPTEVCTSLLDEGEYLCSVSTMYRILAKRGEVKERRAQRQYLDRDRQKEPNYKLRKFSPMSKRRSILLLITFALVGVVGSAFAQSPSPASSSDLDYQLKNLHGLSDDQLVNLYNQYEAEENRREFVLRQQLASGDKETQYKAAFLLGATRSPSAVMPLISCLTLEDTNRQRGSGSRVWFWYRYPAVTALGTIGAPSVPQLIDVLATSDDQKVKALALVVFTLIEDDDKVTEAVLSSAAGRETDHKRKARLTNIVKGFMSESSNFGYLRGLLKGWY